MRSRLSTRISQTCRKCLQDDHSRGRAARRCYGTVNTDLPAQATRSETRNSSPFDLAAAVKSSNPETIRKVNKKSAPVPGRRSESSQPTVTRHTQPRPGMLGASTTDAAMASASIRSASRLPSSYHIPEVLISAEDARSTPGPKIHILGQDERSTFIAHALSGVYDSVSMLTWKPNPDARYQSVQRARTNGMRGFEVPTKRAIKQEPLEEFKKPIDNLVITDGAGLTMKHVQAISGQVHQDTNVCVVHEGFGVLEDVRQQFLNDGVNGLPKLYGGYLSHKLVRNRNVQGVRQLKGGMLGLYEHQATPRARAELKTEAQWEHIGMYNTLRAAPELSTEIMTYSDWIAKKLPSVVFDTVVEPVCAFFDFNYEDMQYNKPALRLMNQLLDELKAFARVAPEMQGPQTQVFMADNFLAAKTMLREIGARKTTPSLYVQRLKTGLPSGVEHTVQYFLRRGKKLGLDMPKLEMMVHAVHAKQAMLRQQLESYVPMEEVAIPMDMSIRHGMYQNSAHDLDELDRGRRTHRWAGVKFSERRE